MEVEKLDPQTSYVTETCAFGKIFLDLSNAHRYI